MGCLRGVLLVALVALPGAASAGGHHLLPERNDAPAVRAAAWRDSGTWRVAPADTPSRGGTRVAALLELDDVGGPVTLEARGVAPDGAAGPWLPLDETFRGDGHRVAVVDLGALWPAAELRVDADDDARIGDLAWELLVPRYPDAGREARAAAAAAPEVLYAVDPVLATLGVVSRATWGARPTTCTATEDDWYRMAVHHTAGAQTSGGTVDGAVRALQAYAQDSGGYCDIPYQFLVGYDGSLWEGRPLTLQSGATGGGNNDGNIAVCFLGCYHPSSCPGGTSHDATDEMIDAARLLVQTLVRLHDIASDAGTIRGHRDWPGNSTACPGEFVYTRLDELRADLAWYTGTETARAFPADGDPAAQVTVDEAAELWIELRNDGGMTWQPGATFLATTGPRDSESPLYDASWATPHRLATVDAAVAPGEIGRFTFAVRAPAAGDYEQSLSLVQEAVTWFADAPWGGGPGDAEIVLRVAAAAPGTDPDPDPEPDPDPDPDPPGGSDTPDPPPILGGCGLAGRTADAPLGWAAALALLLWRRRRRSVL